MKLIQYCCVLMKRRSGLISSTLHEGKLSSFYYKSNRKFIISLFSVYIYEDVEDVLLWSRSPTAAENTHSSALLFLFVYSNVSPGVLKHETVARSCSIPWNPRQPDTSRSLNIYFFSGRKSEIFPPPIRIWFVKCVSGWRQKQRRSGVLLKGRTGLFFSW